MYDYIKGSLASLTDTYAVVDVNGVGYKILTTAKSLETLKADETVTLFTYLHVREGLMDLYGFTSAEERSTFELLISVSGVGPKAAINILSAMPAEGLALAIVANDIKSITTAQGIGQKLAQRIVLELKDKIKSEDFVFGNQNSIVPQTSLKAEAAEALIMLGYTSSAAANAIKRVEKGLTLEETIKKALKNLSI